jgi:YVTN family beta-propeller protein
MRLLLWIGITVCSAGVAGAGKGRLYVSCEESGEIAVVDPATDARVATWPVGKRPRGLRLSHDGKKLYVALSGSPNAGPPGKEQKAPPAEPDRTADGIAELDVSGGKRLRMLPSGQDPEAFDLSADGKTLYVSNEETAQASVVDVAAGKIRKLVAVGGEPEGVRLRPDGKVVYVTSESDNAIFVVDTARAKVVAKMEMPPRPRGIVFSSDGKWAYVSAENAAAVAVVDAVHHKRVADIVIPRDGITGPLPARPMGLALSADAKLLYVANGRGGTVSVVDTAARKVVRTIAGVGARPWGLALSADGKKLYSANGPSNDVSVIDLATDKVAARIPVCGAPWGLALSP